MNDPDPLLATARRLAAEGRADEAAEAYRAARALAPAEVARYVGLHAAQRRRWVEAATTLAQAEQLAPGDPEVLEHLGLAHERIGALAPAQAALERALAADPQRCAARLVLGFVEQREGRTLTAVAHMIAALQQARQRGQWQDARSTEPWLQDHVQGAVAFVGQQQLEMLRAPLRDAPGDLRRVEAFISSQLGRERARSPDPRQRPKQHYFPGLPASPWLDPALFPWTRRVQEAFPVILEEYLALVGANIAFESFLTFRSAEQVAKYLGTTGPAPEWNAFFFYRHGERHDANCARCPRTAALLDALPLIRLPGATPEICFSLLTPGSHILPHHGDSNLRSVVHLGLVVPENCALNVAGEARTWQAGGLLAFDDTYEHEAWNRSGATRAILLMDAWSPHLTEDEKRVLPAVVGAMTRLGAEVERVKTRAA
jgi:aspartate beta-hydroxylase